MTSRPALGWMVLWMVACDPMPGASPGMPPLTPPQERLAARSGSTQAPQTPAEAAPVDAIGAPTAAEADAPQQGLAGPGVVGAGGAGTASAVAPAAASEPSDPFAAALAAQASAVAAAPSPSVGTAPVPATATPVVGGAASASGSPASAAEGSPRASTPVGVPTSTQTAVRWTPGAPAGRWSVRLLRILPDVAPPRAVLGLPSGREIVVSPGTMVPEHELVVMAIGADAVQVDRIVADGDRTRIETEILQPLNGAAR